MEFQEQQLLLYAVTNHSQQDARTLYHDVEEALLGGVTIVQLRDKQRSTEALIQLAVPLCELCHRYHVPLIVNDNAEAALRSGADGVHVGIEDQSVAEIRRMAGSHFIIGATAKTVVQAQNAQAEGADYLGVGAVFPSPTKTNAIRITNEQLSEICQSVTIPCVAIGGITEENAASLAGCGVKGIAVVSALFSSGHIRESAAALQNCARMITKEGRHT